MAFQVSQNLGAQLPAILITSGTGVVRTGLVYTDVSVEFRRATDGAFVFKALQSGDFSEIGNGLYQITFVADDLRALGQFHFAVRGTPALTPAIQLYVGEAEVTSTATPGTAKTVPVNNLTGNLVDTAGQPLVGAGVAARLISTQVIGGTLSVGLGSGVVSTQTDSNGFFILTIAQGAFVEVTIPAANYKRQLTVPVASSTPLFTVS